MKVIHRLISKFKDHRGAAAIIVAISMAVLIGIAALSIDVGYITTTKGELKNIADAASLAATGELGKKSSDAEIIAVAKDVALKNQAGGKNIVLLDKDIIIKPWEGSLVPNAVSVTARRDSSANTPVTKFFAKIFSKDDIDVSASATAALLPLGKTFKVELPVGISREWFEKYYCEKPITFHGKDNCAAWHCFSSSHCCGGEVSKLLRKIIDGNFETPEIIAGETEYSFSECGCGKACDLLNELFEKRKKEEEPYDKWTTTIVVYDLGCSEHHGCHKLATIIGFASITITKISCSSKKEIEIEAKVICEYVTEGRGGGGEYGTYGNIPSLVE